MTKKSLLKTIGNKGFLTILLCLISIVSSYVTTIVRSAWVNQEITVYLSEFESSPSNWSVHVQNTDEIYQVGQVNGKNEEGIGHVYIIRNYFEGDSKVDVTINGVNHVLIIRCKKCTPVFTQESVGLHVGQSKTLAWGYNSKSPGKTRIPKDGIESFISSDPNVVTVDDNGVVQGVKEGTAIITATSYYGTTATCEVNVYNAYVVESGNGLSGLYMYITIPSENISTKILDKEYTIAVGVQARLKCNFSTQFVNPDYYSSCPNVIEVSENGTLNIKAPGNCVITAKWGGYTFSCSFHVVVPSISLNYSFRDEYKDATPVMFATTSIPSYYNQVINWSSSNPDCIAITKTYRVLNQSYSDVCILSAVGYGTSIITASTSDGRLMAQCEINVLHHQLNTTLEVKDMSVYPGNPIWLPVEMNNLSAITAMQCDIELSNGLTFPYQYPYPDWYICYTKLGDRSSERNPHELEGRLTNLYDKARITAYSGSNSPFSGNDGVLFYIKMDIDYPENKVYSVKLRNIKLSGVDGIEYECDNVDAKITVGEYLKGDSNRDGNVDINDVVNTVAYILGKSVKISTNAADVDRDGEVDINDVVRTVSLILNQ